MRRVARCAGLASAVLGFTACAYPPLPGATPPPQEQPQHGTVHKDFPVTANRNLDVLFVIDNSASMADKQNLLIASFPRFITALSTLSGDLPDIHIAVVTSDYGTKGSDDAMPGTATGTGQVGSCEDYGDNAVMQLSGVATTDGKNFLSNVRSVIPGQREQNYDSSVDLAGAFDRMARVGAAGCGFEQHLEVMKQALQPGKVENAGFLRSEAILAVVILADEDDCSMTHSTLLEGSITDTGALGPAISFRCTRFGVLCDDGGATPDAMNQVGAKGACHPAADTSYLTSVAGYAEMLKALKPQRDDVVVAGIIGPVQPFATELRILQGAAPTSMKYPQLAHSCSYIDASNKLETADPAVRIQSLLDQFPGRNASAPVCGQDLSPGVQLIADAIKRAMAGDPCIASALADLDPSTPGPQHDCTVAAVTAPGTPAQNTTELPRCAPYDAMASNKPCWRLTANAACPSADHLALTIEGRDVLPGAARIIASCVTDEPGSAME